MKTFVVSPVEKWTKVAQLNIDLTVYGSMNLGQINYCISEFLKRNEAKQIVAISSKEIYKDYQNNNTHIRVSLDKVNEIVTITYSRIDTDYRVVFVTENK